MLTLLLLSLTPAQFVVENKTTPTFTVTNKIASAKADPRGVWSPYWDGRQWQPRWLKEGVSHQAIPKASSATTPTTPATPVVVPSTSSNGSTPMVRTLTGAPAGTYGVTDNCPPMG